MESTWSSKISTDFQQLHGVISQKWKSSSIFQCCISKHDQSDLLTASLNKQ
jgi:hypothetical protein